MFYDGQTDIHKPTGDTDKATFFTFCSEPSSIDRTKLDHKHSCVGSLGEYKYGSLSRLKMGEIPHP